ncbi:MAG: hypothetical protein L7T62_01075 [Flavobacteriaceae bacterium]|nr:hypothetical protein [Flavobacteriaceae bacterium]
MKQSIKPFSLILLLLSLMIGCNSNSYEKTIKKELARGITIDSMPFGLKLGNSKKDFYERCWALNKTGVITQGPGNEYARHYMEPKDEKGKRIDMLFFGIFDEYDKMTGMKMEFSYTGWSPWAKEYQSEVLKEAIEDTLMKWFPGNEFKDVDLKIEDVFASYKIEANLKFKLFKIDDRQIGVRIEQINP